MKYGRTVVYQIRDETTNEVLYVGMTSNLAKRLIAHRGPSGRYSTGVTIKASRPMAHHEAADLEKSLIRKYSPRDNVVHTPKHGPICMAARATWIAGPWGTKATRRAS